MMNKKPDTKAHSSGKGVRWKVLNTTLKSLNITSNKEPLMYSKQEFVLGRSVGTKKKLVKAGEDKLNEDLY